MQAANIAPNLEAWMNDSGGRKLAQISDSMRDMEECPSLQELVKNVHQLFDPTDQSKEFLDTWGKKCKTGSWDAWENHFLQYPIPEMVLTTRW